MYLRNDLIFLLLKIIVISGMLVPLMLTLLPGDAVKLNRFGYRSRCSFAPWSTLALVAITAGLLGIVHLLQVVLAG